MDIAYTWDAKRCGRLGEKPVFYPKESAGPRVIEGVESTKAQEGRMILCDSSSDRWFGPIHPPGCLLAAIDDATEAILAARFFLFEGTEGYLGLLRQMVTRYRIPVSIYQDRHGSLKGDDDHWSLEEELAGRQEPTQVEGEFSGLQS